MPVSYRFDRFELRCAQHELVGPGRKVHLKARTMALLMALIENQASVVSKERLLELVWPDSAVEENNLAVHVSTLRKLLGHKAIVTVPGRGYRFCLQVEPTDDGDPAADVALQMAGAGLPERPVLFGREQELLELLNLAERHRVVTVCGPTGVGKTSLAVAAAHELAGSRHVVWLDLSGNEQEQRVPLLLAQALHIDVVDNDNKDDDVCAALVAHLRGPQWLLIIDSAEHALRPVAELVRTLLAGGQELHALVTNQAPLHLEGERVFRLRPLSVPQTDVTPEQALRHGAIALFVDQAQAADRRFALTTANTSQVVELCRQLDGLPLGIKLAAARMRMFGVQGLDARLSDRFRLLKATSVDLPSRQQTLIAALDWSHGLLSAVEQAVFRRLGVFAGGFTLELAAATARDEPLDHSAVEDALQGLIDHSLVAIEQVDPPRYRLLESARDYALLRLARAGEEHTTRHRHARALHALFEALDSAYWAPDKAEVPSPSAHAAEIANLRVALDWCLANDMLLGVQILGTLQVLFDWLGLHHEARERHARFALAAGGAPPPVFARFCATWTTGRPWPSRRVPSKPSRRKVRRFESTTPCARSQSSARASCRLSVAGRRSRSCARSRSLIGLRGCFATDVSRKPRCSTWKAQRARRAVQPSNA